MRACLVVLALLLLVAAATARNTMKSNANQQFVSARIDHDNLLIAQSSCTDSWETFEIVDLGGDLIGIRAQANGLFLSVREDNQVRAVGQGPGPWEVFHRVDAGGGYTVRGVVWAGVSRGHSVLTGRGVSSSALSPSRPCVRPKTSST